MVEYMETWIYSRAKFDTKEKAEKLLRTIYSYDEFTPERWSWGTEPVRNKFSKDDLEGPIEALINKVGNEFDPENIGGELLMKRTKEKPRLWCAPKWERYQYYPFGISSYNIAESYVKNKENLEKWLDYNHKLVEVHNGWFGFIATRDESEYKIVVRYKRHDGVVIGASPGTQLGYNIPGVFWGNYFGKFYIDWFGRDKFDTLPRVTKKDLPNGAIFFTTAETPWDWNTEECRRLQRKVMEHLGKDAFFDIEQLRKDVEEKLGKGGITELEQLIPKHRVPEFPFKFKKLPWKH